MKEELQKTLFIHQNMESPLYYLSGTIVLSIAIMALVGIVVYSVYSSLKRHKGASYTPEEFKELQKISLVQYATIILGSFLVFVISLTLFPNPLLVGWAENAGVLVFIPFIAAISIGGLGKVSNFKNNPFIHSFSFWKVYLFTLLYLGFRFLAF